MTMKEEYTAIDMATAAADGFRAGQRAAQSAGVPDVSVMARVLSDRSADACNVDRADNWAMYGQEYIEDVQAMLAAAPAAPTVKAEQVQCDTCHGQSEICVGQQTFGYMSMQPPEPIMEVCPECGGEEAPSLPAAGSAVEEVEVRGFQWLDKEHYRKNPHVNQYEWNPLMTVAQHQRIVAALSAQQPAPDQIRVPVELLELLRNFTVQHDSGVAGVLRGNIDSLLASHAGGWKV